jgi:hypothetical protein
LATWAIDSHGAHRIVMPSGRAWSKTKLFPVIPPAPGMFWMMIRGVPAVCLDR